MSINLDYDNYETKIQSFTHKKIYNVIVSKKFLTPEDHVLIIDDFLANGCALLGLLELTEKAGATVEGIGIAVEKASSRAATHPQQGHPAGEPRHRRVDGQRHRRDRVPRPAAAELNDFC